MATSSSLFFFPPHASLAPSRVSYSFSGRICDITCPCIAGAEMRPRRRKKAGEKRSKLGGSKGFGKSGPRDSLNEDIEEQSKEPVSRDIPSTSHASQQSSNYSLTHTSDITSREGNGYLKDENNMSRLERTPSIPDKSDEEVNERQGHEHVELKESNLPTVDVEEFDEGLLEIKHGINEEHKTVETVLAINNLQLENSIGTVELKDVSKGDAADEGSSVVGDGNRINVTLSLMKDESDSSPLSRGTFEVRDTTVSATTEENLEASSLNVAEDAKSSETDDMEFNTERYLQQIRNLAAKTEKDSGKIFSFPEVLKAGNVVEIFLNRSASSLAQDTNIKITGAYNDWRWKHFEVELKKTILPNDWWYCKLQIPVETYKMDFVFHNSLGVYENNSTKDFHLDVEDGMLKDDFEDYLIEEKKKEMERIAAERAEEERRLAEEQRLIKKGVAEEADRQEARIQVNDRREKISLLLQKAVRNVDGLWHFQPSEFQGGDTVKLFYNRLNRALASCAEVWIHGGYNNWQEMVSIVGKLNYHSADNGDWWTIDVQVPKQAFLLNWVLADGPPEQATIYDNNEYQDFNALIPNNVSYDSYWKEIEEQIYKQLQIEREIKEDAIQKKAQHTSQIKAAFKAKTKNNILKSQAHIFYTDPVDVEAGKNATIFYNPSSTVLNGKHEVWLRASFNRWTHKLGPLLPIQMLPAAEDTPLLKGTVRVPLDAYMMDFVFSERGDDVGGVYDNNYGMDYHVPVVGSFANEPPMKIVHISVEMAPIAKVGGLGDVVTSLSRAIQELGHNVEVVLPKYDCLKYDHIKDLQEKFEFFWGGARIKVWSGIVEGLLVNFLEPDNGMVWAGCVYGRRDDGQRFGFFCHAALEFLMKTGQTPDIIHCHDWSSAPVAWLFHDHYKQTCLSNSRIVFTIHNLEFGTALIGKAMAFTDKATTVSETYAFEVSGNSAIAPHRSKFHGIRNGIDLDIWDPYNDLFIPSSYTSENVSEGKKRAKEELQSRLGLAKIDRPLVGIITRLTAQKGIHLIKHGIWKTLERGGQVVLLGSAPDPRIQNDFNNLANELHNSQGEMARLCLHYDEPLSHLIYAGADFILIPSMFEPCGLTQLIAMRYGAIPIVRRTGGLNDTVFDVDHDRDRALYNGIEPNGFSFDGADAAGLDYALNRALSAWYDSREWFNSLCKQVMEQDWSWNRPALDYMELYYSARK